MFQKHSIMSLKKKSKSLGHLTALGSHPGSPDCQPKVNHHSTDSTVLTSAIIPGIIKVSGTLCTLNVLSDGQARHKDYQ